jgi:hypothetical protein
MYQLFGEDAESKNRDCTGDAVAVCTLFAGYAENVPRESVERMAKHGDNARQPEQLRR